LLSPLAAQNVLYTEVEGKFRPVIRARDNQAYVKIGDQLVIADSHRYALSKVEEYLPVYVSVKSLDVKTTYLDMNGSQINNDFLLHASLECPFSLNDVFIVLELDTVLSGKLIFLQEVGSITAREPKHISIRVPLSSALGSGQYVFHLFSQGMELLQSQIAPLACDEAVDRMIAKRLPPGPDAAPRLFIGPAPEYPEEQLKTKADGQAVIAVRIGANGRVYDPEVKSASTPAIGMAALKAVRLWRFIPQMKSGRPVETKAEIPISFAPVQPAGKS
jgi:TonB family protein